MALLAITATAAFILGIIFGEGSVKHRQVMDETRSIQKFLHQHPEKYARLTVDERSEGHAYLKGEVTNQQDLDLFRTQMQRQFGEERARNMTVEVEVATLAADE